MALNPINVTPNVTTHQQVREQINTNFAEAETRLGNAETKLLTVGANTETRLTNAETKLISDKGYYATTAALLAAHPTATDGAYARVGDTDTIWMWDSGAWKNTDNVGSGATPIASEAEEIAGVVTTKVSSPGGRSSWWTNLKTLAQTIAGRWYFSSGIESTYYDFDDITPPASPAANVGRLYAVNESGLTTLEYKSPSGFVIRAFRDSPIVVRNTSGVAITKGRAVYVTGVTGNDVPTVSLAQADSVAKLAGVLVAAQDMDNNAFGRCFFLGKISGVNTTGMATGQLLYVSQTTPGAFTNVEPTTGLKLEIGTVLSAGNNGAITVKIGQVSNLDNASAATIKAKLESLTGNARLDVSAIKNLTNTATYVFNSPVGVAGLYLWMPAWRQAIAANAGVAATLDFSGQNRGGVQATAANQMVFTVNVHNNRASFRGVTNDAISLSNALDFTSNRSSVSITQVFWKTANTGAIQLLFGAAQTGSTSYHFWQGVTNTLLQVSTQRLDTDTAKVQQIPFTDTLAPHLVHTEVDYVLDTVNVWLDGVQVVTNSTVNSTAGSGVSRTGNSNNVTVGAGPVANLGMVGHLFDTVLSTPKTTTQERLLLQEYAKSYYALPI